MHISMYVYIYIYSNIYKDSQLCSRVKNYSESMQTITTKLKVGTYPIMAHIAHTADRTVQIG